MYRKKNPKNTKIIKNKNIGNFILYEYLRFYLYTHMEKQYLDLLSTLLKTGERRETRSGSVYSSFGHVLKCDLQKEFPLLTTKKMFFRGIVEELSWFLRGSTNVQELRDRWVHIWDSNTEDRNYDAGPVYGFQWRHFGAEYKTCNDTYEGVDQIAQVIHLLRQDPTSRRIFLSAWNPKQQSEMALPPCHVSYQFYVSNNQVHCQMYQRSADVFLGLPFNIASTALLVHLLASECGREPGKLRIVIGDAHLYESHVGVAMLQCERDIKPAPTLQIAREQDGLWKVNHDEIILRDYECHGVLKAKMAK